MTLYKSAQFLDNDDDVSFAKDDIFEPFGDSDQVVVYEQKPEVEEVVEAHKPDGVVEIVFELPVLPGSEADMPVEVLADEPVSNKEEEKVVAPTDPWNWQAKGPESVLEWVKERFSNIPRHTGKETAGIERAISYLKRLNSEMSKAASNDYDGKIDIEKFEQARKEIYSAIDRLEDAKEKLEEKHYKSRKKKSDVEQDGMVKSAQKAGRIDGTISTVPVFISSLARAAINSCVSAGKDIERTTAYFVKKFNLTDRDQVELYQTICDMGFPAVRPRGLLFDEGDMDPKSVDNVDYMASYPA